MSRGGASAHWNDVWLEEHLEERRSKRKKTSEEKRYEEIKAGVITTSAGVGATIFLFFLMNALAVNEPQDAALFRTIWLVGLVPTLIGLGILFNGVFISRKLVELKNAREFAATPVPPEPLFAPVETARSLSAANAQPSVIEHTTAHLGDAAAVNARRETH